MFNYIPSPIEFDYDIIYKAVTNRSGRMQYYKMPRGQSRERISRKEFTDMYNHSKIVAVKPIQGQKLDGIIQMDIYVKQFEDQKQ